MAAAVPGSDFATSWAAEGRAEPIFPKDLIIVTHRGPITVAFNSEGKLVAGPAAGGLAPSLTRALAGSGTGWIACAMSDGERKVAHDRSLAELVPGIIVTYLDLPREVVHDAYNRIANETLWFIHHDMADEAKVRIDASWLEAFDNFRRYNEAFAKAICASAPADATVMVNDYHLPLVGPILRAERPDIASLHFSHTPFCTPEQLARLPYDIAHEIIGAMTAFGACGFHTERWAAAFRACVELHGLTAPPLFACPLGVDAELLAAEAASPTVQALRVMDNERFAGKKVIFRSDRLEPTKNIVRGFAAFETLLERHRELIGEVVFLARSYVSRSDIALYKDYRTQIEKTAAQLNRRYHRPGYQPVIIEIDDVYDASIAAYFDYDVLLVNPLMDGMNLVAKEAPVVNTNDGVVVLSKNAGAYEALGPVSIGVDPFDIDATADALYEGLMMDRSERHRLSVALKELSSTRPPARWLEEALGYARQPDAA